MIPNEVFLGSNHSRKNNSIILIHMNDETKAPAAPATTIAIGLGTCIEPWRKEKCFCPNGFAISKMFLPGKEMFLPSENVFA